MGGAWSTVDVGEELVSFPNAPHLHLDKHRAVARGCCEQFAQRDVRKLAGEGRHIGVVTRGSARVRWSRLPDVLHKRHIGCIPLRGGRRKESGIDGRPCLLKQFTMFTAQHFRPTQQDGVRLRNLAAYVLEGWLGSTYMYRT